MIENHSTRVPFNTSPAQSVVPNLILNETNQNVNLMNLIVHSIESSIIRSLP